MKKLLFLSFLTIGMFSCQDKDELPPPPKNEPEVPMRYTDLNNREVKHELGQGIDADNDGRNDFVFYVLPIGDPIFKQDKYRFLVQSNLDCYLFVDDNNNSPVLDKGSIVKKNNIPPHEWFDVSEVYLGQKVINDNGSIHWEGPWKDMIHKHIAIQLRKPEGIFNGWIEFSFDSAAEKIVLHKAALSKEADKDVKIK
jgi:hypothetical protein